MSAVLKHIPTRLLMQIVRHRLLAYLGLCAPWIIARSWPGLLVCLLLMACDLIWIWRQSQIHFLSWLNAAFPAFEDSLQLLEHAEKNSPLIQLQRARLLQRLETVLTPAAFKQLGARELRFSRWTLAGLFFMSATLAALLTAYTHPVQTMAPRAVASVVQSTSVSALSLTLSLKVNPPAYTQVPATQSVAQDLQVPEHSQIEWCIAKSLLNAEYLNQVNASHIRLSNGQEMSFAEDSGTTCARWEASETVFWSWSADTKQHRYTLKVTQDQAPEIAVLQPLELLQVLSTQTQNITMSIQIKDDYQIANASVHMTLARGSGENIRFSDKEIVIPQGSDQRQRQWNKRWSLTELGMEPGDELYFFVRASDNAAKNPHIVRSPTYTLRLPAPDALEEETSVLPILVKPESLRSQRQIIIDTEQLVTDMQANPKLNPPLIRNRSEMIANDQAALRRRYGRFLGEESSLFGDEHEDGAHANEKPVGDLAAQYGHAHDQEENATLFDEATKKILRRALVAMWDAEKSLRAITPKTALAPENKALEAIKQLQQADRIYLHKAAFTPPAIKEEKRLSGDVLDVKNQQRMQAESEIGVPAELTALLSALAKADTLPALWSKTARAWIATHISDDEQRLKAQSAVQDVADGCQPCRAELAAWLRQGIANEGISLQAASKFKASQAGALDRYWNAHSLPAVESQKTSAMTQKTTQRPTQKPVQGSKP